MPPELTALATPALHWSVGLLLAFPFCLFYWQFFRSGLRIGRQLKQANQRLIALKAVGPVLDFKACAAKRWSAMPCATPGTNTATRCTARAGQCTGHVGSEPLTPTSMANGFFTDQSLIAVPLRTEFYKYQGILTGLGIIGTFSGLIIGLQGFKVTDDAQVVRRSLETLIF